MICKRKLIEDLKNNLIVVVDRRLISTGSEFGKESGSPRHGKRKKRQGKKIHKAERKKRVKRKIGKINQSEDLAENDRLLIMMKLLMTSLMRTRDQQMKDPYFWTDVDDEGNEKYEWYAGQVVGILDGDEYSSECEFRVTYDVDNDNDFTVVALIED